MKKRYSNIPIFLPELACPHRCVFCNQSHISGMKSIPSTTDVVATIEKYLATIHQDTHTQVAFFGGSFTGLPLDMQDMYLSVVQPYIDAGSVEGIRISTRPDYISEPILDLLKKNRVLEVELGAQSFDDEVLKAAGRGHSSADIRKAADLILSHDLRLGLQMMIGLPADTIDKTIYTAKSIISSGAQSTRIYPTLVIADTHLAELYRQGTYTPLSLEQAVEWSAIIFQLFENAGLSILRTGLHPSEELNTGKSLIAGPYHPSFKELVKSRIWKQLFDEQINYRVGKLLIHVSEDEVNSAIGYHSINRIMIKERTGWVKIIADKSLTGYEFRHSYH